MCATVINFVSWCSKLAFYKIIDIDFAVSRRKFKGLTLSFSGFMKNSL